MRKDRNRDRGSDPGSRIRLLKNAICFHAFGHAAGVTSSFVIAAYGLYASFLRIRAPCIASFLTSLLELRFFNGWYGGCGKEVGLRLGSMRE